QLQSFGSKRLRPQAEPIDAVGSHQVYLFGIQIGRIGLDAEFVASRQGKPAQNDFQQPFELSTSEMSGSSTAEKQCVDFARLDERRRLWAQRRQIGIDKIIAARHDCEVAIATPMPTERNVDIGGTGTGEVGTRKSVCGSGTKRVH